MLIYLCILLNIAFTDELKTVEILEDFNSELSYRASSLSTKSLIFSQTAQLSYSAEDFFRADPTIIFKTQGSPGFSVSGSQQSGRTLVMVDDIPLNFIDGFGASDLFFPIEIIQQIVTRDGPSSTSYGAPAMSASINLKTQFVKSPELRLGFFDYDESFLPNKRSQLSVFTTSYAQPIIHNEKNKVQLSTYFAKDRGDFSYTSSAGQSLVRNSNESFLKRFIIKGEHISRDSRISETLLVADINKHTPGSQSFPFVGRQDRVARLASFGYEKFINTKVFSLSRLTYHDLISKYSSSTIGRIKSLQLKATQGLGVMITSNLLSKTFIDFDWSQYSETYSAYNGTQWSSEVSQNLNWSRNGLQLKPSLKYLTRFKKTLLGLDVQKSYKHINGWLSFQQGYRPPSLSDMHSNSFGYTGNISLDPERSNRYEAGLDYQLASSLVSTSFFVTDYSETFRREALGAGQSTKVNSGSAELKGHTLNLKHSFGSFTAKASYQYMSGKNKSDQLSMLLVPRHSSYVGVSYKYLESTFRIEQSWVSRMLDINFGTQSQVELPSQSSLNIYYGIALQKTDIELSIVNLLDRSFELSYDYPEPGRRYGLTLRHRF